MTRTASNNRDLRRTIGKLRRLLKKAQNELRESDALLQEICDILSSKDAAPRSSGCMEKERPAPNSAITLGGTQAHSEQSALPIHTGEDASTTRPCLQGGSKSKILKEAQRFKRFWAKYNSLHNEVSKAPGAVADSKRDTLLLMHERLDEMKAAISKSGGSEAPGSLVRA